MKKCSVCEKEIIKIGSNRQSLCSDECREIRKVEHNKSFQERRRIKKGQSLYANCSICGSEFFKGEERGKHSKAFCSEKCKKEKLSFFSKEQLKKRKDKKITCTIDGCFGLAIRENYTLCENHYYQRRRTGSFDKKVWSRTADHGHYVRVLGAWVKTHPMKTKKTGMLYEHRMVAYDSRDGICEPCFWCGKQLEWENCVIDHLNEDKHDNRPENLLIACTHCNRARGAMLGFIARMKESSLPVFYKAVHDYRKTHGTFEKEKTLAGVVQFCGMEEVKT